MMNGPASIFCLMQFSVSSCYFRFCGFKLCIYLYFTVLMYVEFTDLTVLLSLVFILILF